MQPSQRKEPFVGYYTIMKITHEAQTHSRYFTNCIIPHDGLKSNSTIKTSGRDKD